MRRFILAAVGGVVAFLAVVSIAAVCSLLLAACGSGHPSSSSSTNPHLSQQPTTTTSSTSTGAPASLHCNPADFTMNCVQPSAPPTLPKASPSISGADFGWSSLSAGQAKASGYRFAASYLSPDASKNWTAALVRAYHAAGLATVYVWEAGATNALDGFNQGALDASRARDQAAAFGHTDGTIFFAVDCDCSGPSVAAYFAGASSVLGPRAGAYGGYSTLQYLCTHGLVGQVNWQTYAWSAGRWLPSSCAPLEQYQNGPVVDQDRAISAYYGQDPYVAPKPKPTAAQIRKWRGALAATNRQIKVHAAALRLLNQRHRWFTARLAGA
jgi:hypothetical protein